MPSATSICCIGAVYVDGPTMAVIADRSPDVYLTVVDLNAERIATWNATDLGYVPVYEPALDAVLGGLRGPQAALLDGVAGDWVGRHGVYLDEHPTKTKGLGLVRPAISSGWRLLVARWPRRPRR